MSQLAPAVAGPAAGRAAPLARLRRLVHARWDLALAFTRRELAIRYREAYVGVAWALLQPLAYALLFALLFSRMAKLPGAGALSAYVALVAWAFIATSLLQGSQSIVSQIGVVTKIYFPRGVLPLAVILAAAVDAAIAFGLELALLVGYGEGLEPTLLLFPPLLLLTAAICFGATLILAPALVRFRDLKYVLPFAVQLLMLASPVGYPLSAVPEGLRRWYELNPFAGLLESFRGIALRGEVPSLRLLAPALVWAVVLLVVGGWFFRRQDSTMADYV